MRPTTKMLTRASALPDRLRTPERAATKPGARPSRQKKLDAAPRATAREISATIQRKREVLEQLVALRALRSSGALLEGLQTFQRALEDAGGVTPKRSPGHLTIRAVGVDEHGHTVPLGGVHLHLTMGDQRLDAVTDLLGHAHFATQAKDYEIGAQSPKGRDVAHRKSVREGVVVIEFEKGDDLAGSFAHGAVWRDAALEVKELEREMAQRVNRSIRTLEAEHRALGGAIERLRRREPEATGGASEKA